jgi:hypothetical protein
MKKEPIRKFAPWILALQSVVREPRSFQATQNLNEAVHFALLLHTNKPSHFGGDGHYRKVPTFYETSTMLAWKKSVWGYHVQ